MAKQVDDRERSTRIVVAAIAEHGPGIARIIQDTLAPIATAKGTAVPDIALFLELCGELLASRAAALVRASNAHDLEMSDDSEPRDRRDIRERDLRNRLSGLRLNVQGTYGDNGLHALALWDPLPPGPGPLKNYTQSVVDALRKPGLTLKPLHQDESFELRPEKAIGSLQPLLEALNDALGDVAREAVELDTTVLAKNAAIAAHDRDFAGFAGLVQALARVAGKPDLADRIRPSGREPGVLLNPNPKEPEPAANTPLNTSTPAIQPGMPGSNPFRD